MSEATPYSITTDISFQGLEKFDVGALADACEEQWFNQTLCQVNDSVARLGVVQGEFHWHYHDDEDELFFVLSGRLFVDIEDRSVELGPRQGFLVPRGVKHRTRAPERTVVLMFAGSGVLPTGD